MCLLPVLFETMGKETKIWIFFVSFNVRIVYILELPCIRKYLQAEDGHLSFIKSGFILVFDYLYLVTERSQNINPCI